MRYSSRVTGSLLTIALIALVATATAAQNRERFGISAKAGGVNAVVGRVMVTRKGQDPQLLTNKEDLVSGDCVTTGSLSHIEVLLNPGSYLRVGEHSEFQFQDNSLDNLKIRMLKGSAIVEATGVSDMDLQIQVVTSQAAFTIIRSGVYRISVQPESAELAVSKGRASFGPDRADIVKGGNKVSFTNGAIARAKVDKNKDEFEVWSKARAELLARANQKLSNRVFNAYLSAFNDWNSPFGSAWNSRRRWGLWTFSPRAGCFTFLPFFDGWSSPYGHYYGNFYWPGFSGQNWNGQPVIVNNQPNPRPGGTPGGQPTPTGGGPSPGPAPAPIPSSPLPRYRDPDTGERIIPKKLDP
jgi:hypothetical protein